SFVAAYLLSGMVSVIVIHLNKKQFHQIEELLAKSEQETVEKAQQHHVLEQNVGTMIAQITNVNDKVQHNAEAQNELTSVITEIAVGSTSQSDQIVAISEHAQSTMEQMSEMLQALQRLQEAF